MIEYLTGVFPGEVATRLLELLAAPVKNPSMIWMTVPLLVSTLLMTVYFGKYRREELGWNTAFGNSMALMFVSLDCIRYITAQIPGNALGGMLASPLKTVVAAVVLAYSFALILLNFFHKMPKWVAFFLADALPINVIAYITLAVVYTGIAVDIPMLVACGILFVILYVLFTIIKLASTGYFLPRDIDARRRRKLEEMKLEKEKLERDIAVKQKEQAQDRAREKEAETAAATPSPVKRSEGRGNAPPWVAPAKTEAEEEGEVKL